MNNIGCFFIEIAITLIVTAIVTRYLQVFLRKVLLDLCGTEDRAQFWSSFSNIVLIGLPMIIALNYRPEATNFETGFFEIASKLSGNLAGMLFALVGLGFVVSIFALFAPRTSKVESK